MLRIGRSGSLKSWPGDCLPSRDFAMLVDLHLAGRLPLDKFVSETIALDQVRGGATGTSAGRNCQAIFIVKRHRIRLTRTSPAVH